MQKGIIFLGSFVLPTPERDLENLGQLLCHSAMHALEEFALVPLFKWPNDILLSYKKVGGVMADVRGDVSVVSLGLNVNMTKAELDSIDTPATSLSEELHAEISLHDVKQSVIKHFTKDLRVFEKEGFAPFFAPFSAKLAFLGKLARAGQTKGVMQGLTPDGRLLLDQTPVSTNVLEVL